METCGSAPGARRLRVDMCTRYLKIAIAELMKMSLRGSDSADLVKPENLLLPLQISLARCCPNRVMLPIT